MKFEDLGDDCRLAAAGLMHLVDLGGHAPLGRAVGAFAIADRFLPFAADSARRRLFTQARALSRQASRFGVRDLAGVLVAYVDFLDRHGGASDLERLGVELLTAALAFDRTGDGADLERAAIAIARYATGDETF